MSQVISVEAQREDELFYDFVLRIVDSREITVGFKIVAIRRAAQEAKRENEGEDHRK